jgi:hypothetical protein
MAEAQSTLEQLLVVAQEQLRWLRASVLPQVRQTIDATLTNTQLRRAYEMCDGKKPGNEIARAVGTTPQSFSNWNKRWRDLGIAYEVEGRIRHLASLASLGLPVEVEDARGRKAG